MSSFSQRTGPNKARETRRTWGTGAEKETDSQEPSQTAREASATSQARGRDWSRATQSLFLAQRWGHELVAGSGIPNQTKGACCPQSADFSGLVFGYNICRQEAYISGRVGKSWPGASFHNVTVCSRGAHNTVCGSGRVSLFPWVLPQLLHAAPVKNKAAWAERTVTVPRYRSV